MLRFTVTLFNFISNPKITRVSRHYTDLVSVLIPVRNEAENILPLLKSIYLQDYSNYEVIVYDDDSSDATYTVCSEFARKHDRFRVLQGGELPDGWTGKNYACDRLAAEARGDYFLFMNAGETVKSGLLNAAVHRCRQYRLGLLSLFANQEMPTFGEKITIPLLYYLLLNLVPLRLIFLIKNAAISVASSQFMFFEAEIYRQRRWHNQVRERIAEEAEIMKLVKSASLNGEVLLANDMLHCRMYQNYKEALIGFSKNILAVFNYSLTGLMAFVLLFAGGPMIVMMTLNFQLIFFMGALILLTRIMISLAAGENVLMNVLLHPVQIANLTIIAFLSVQKHLTKTNIWKGRRIGQ